MLLENAKHGTLPGLAWGTNQENCQHYCAKSQYSSVGRGWMASTTEKHLYLPCGSTSCSDSSAFGVTSPQGSRSVWWRRQQWCQHFSRIQFGHRLRTDNHRWGGCPLTGTRRSKGKESQFEGIHSIIRVPFLNALDPRSSSSQVELQLRRAPNATPTGS